MSISEADILRIVGNETNLQAQIRNTLRKEQEQQAEQNQITVWKQQLNSLVATLQGAVINVSIIDAYQTPTLSNQVTITTTAGKIRVTDIHIVQEA